MHVCQEELRLPFPVSNKLSRNRATGYASPFWTLWQLRFRPVFKKNSEFREESNAVSFILPKPGPADPSRGLARTSLGPSWAVGQVLTSRRQPWATSISRCPPGHPSPLGLTAEPSLSGGSTAGTQSPVKDSKPACSRHSFSFGKQRLFFLLLQPPLSDPVWPVIKGKASPSKMPELSSPGALSPNLHASTLWLPLRKLHLFKPLSPCKENTGDVSRTRLPSPQIIPLQ